MNYGDDPDRRNERQAQNTDVPHELLPSTCLDAWIIAARMERKRIDKFISRRRTAGNPANRYFRPKTQVGGSGSCHRERCLLALTVGIDHHNGIVARGNKKCRTL